MFERGGGVSSRPAPRTLQFGAGAGLPVVSLWAQACSIDPSKVVGGQPAPAMKRLFRENREGVYLPGTRAMALSSSNIHGRPRAATPIMVQA
jgi:hypothetical protein